MRRVCGVFLAFALGIGVLEALLLLGGFERRVELDPFTRAFAGGRIDGLVVHELDARQLWQPIAGATTPWGRDVLDEHGCRNAPLAPARRPGVARIAALGDSTAFGRGVDARACWIEVAAHTLVERGIPCEALNAGVVGFTVRQGRERYERVVRPFAPDVVVLSFGAFEEHTPALGRSDAAWIAAGGGPSADEGPFGRLGREARGAQLARWITSGFPARAADGDSAPRELPAGEDRAGAVAWPGERRVSVNEFATELRALAALVIADGARVVFLDPARRPQYVAPAPVLALYSAETRAVAAELGAPLVDGRAVFGSAVQAGATYPDLFAGGAADPAVLGHERLGVALAELVAPLLRGPAAGVPR
jgi:hypothetical protein